MKRILAIGMALAMLVGTMTVSAGAVDENVTYNASVSGYSQNTAHGGGVVEGDGYTPGTTIGTGSVDVMVQTATEPTITNVYSVGISTTTLTFNYGGAASYIWNPTDLRYEVIGNTGGDGTLWTATTGDTIEVTNYSDLPIEVEASYTADGTVTESDQIDVTLTPDVGGTPTLSLESAVTTGDLDATGEPVADSFTVALSGNLTYSYRAPAKLGTITLEIKVPTA